MLRLRRAVRPLTQTDRDDALALCAEDLTSSVFVAARILENPRSITQVLGFEGDRGLDALCWTCANVMPVAADSAALAAFAHRLGRGRQRHASLLGPRPTVVELWSQLETAWGPARTIRGHQPLLETRTPPSVLGVAADDRVRRARPGDVDRVLPAAVHMFTHEIGYRPFSGSSRSYRDSLRSLIDRGHTWIVVEDGAVVFKADVGSAALGWVQLQGVWIAPWLRGQGYAVPMLAAVLDQLFAEGVVAATLYVNDFNTPALAAYRHLGFTEVGEFATVLL